MPSPPCTSLYLQDQQESVSAVSSLTSRPTFKGFTWLGQAHPGDLPFLINSKLTDLRPSLYLEIPSSLSHTRSYSQVSLTFKGREGYRACTPAGITTTYHNALMEFHPSQKGKPGQVMAEVANRGQGAMGGHLGCREDLLCAVPTTACHPGA